MKAVLGLGGLVLVVGLLGCPIYHINTLPASKELDEPAAEPVSGSYQHRSGVRFPEHIDQFARVSITRYDTASLNVGVGYNRVQADCPGVLTVNVSPAPRVTHLGGARDMVRGMEWGYLQHYFSATQAEIERHHPQSFIYSAEEVPPLSGEWLPGMQATYGVGSSTSLARCYIFDHTWFFKLRLTLPATCDADASSELSRVIETLWPAA